MWLTIAYICLVVYSYSKNFEVETTPFPKDHFEGISNIKCMLNISIHTQVSQKNVVAALYRSYIHKFGLRENPIGYL